MISTKGNPIPNQNEMKNARITTEALNKVCRMAVKRAYPQKTLCSKGNVFNSDNGNCSTQEKTTDSIATKEVSKLQNPIHSSNPSDRHSREISTVSDDDLCFLENFSSHYFGQDDDNEFGLTYSDDDQSDSDDSLSDFSEKSKLLEDLKQKFPVYFNRHEKYKEATTLNQESFNNIFAGIIRLYNLEKIKSQPFMNKHNYHTIETTDNGHCLYDSIWKGLNEQQKNTL